MRLTLPAFVIVAVLAGLLHQPQPAFGQSKEINALQRDIYDLTRKIEELRGGQAEKSEEMQTLLKQVMDANASLTAELKALQDATRKTQADQQSLVIMPMNALKVSVDDTSNDVAGMQGLLGTMRTRQESMESLLNDLKAQMTVVLKQTELIQAPPAVSAVPNASDAATLLFASGQRDRLTGRPNFALQAFSDVAQNYPEAPEAPMAMYEVGALYAANGEYANALKAFDQVIERFSDNPMRKMAQFRKAQQLENLDRNADAIKEYNAFAKQYPGEPETAEALARAKELSAPAPRAKQPTKSKAKR